MDEGLRDRLASIDDRLSRIETRLMDHPPCPHPGMCVEVRNLVDAQSNSVLQAHARIARLERWQAGMVAIGLLLTTVLIPVLAIFGPVVRHFLRLP